MKISFLALIMFFLCACNKDASKIEKISILSYNVAGLPAILSSSKPATNTHQIGTLIRPYDIVHVQEDFCFNDILYKYDTHSNRTETSGCVPGGDGLNTLSNFPILNFKRISWGTCNGTDCLTPKGFSYSQILINGQKLDCYNVHCNAGSSTNDLKARSRNIVQLTQYINSHSKDRPCLVFGDLNSRYTREGDTIRAFFDLGFKDVWIEQIRLGEVPELGAPALLDCTEKTSKICEVVDKVFYRSSDDFKLTPTYYQLDDPKYYDSKGRPISDHNPTFVNFAISTK